MRVALFLPCFSRERWKDTSLFGIFWPEFNCRIPRAKETLVNTQMVAISKVNRHVSQTYPQIRAYVWEVGSSPGLEPHRSLDDCGRIGRRHGSARDLSPSGLGKDGHISAATDLAWRPRPRDEATRGGRLPRLVRLVLWCSCGSGRSRRGRSGSFFCYGLGQRGRRSSVVLLETAVLIFAARAAMTALVARRSCTDQSSH